MNIDFKPSADADILVYHAGPGGALPEAAQVLDSTSGGHIEAAVAGANFKGQPGQVVSIPMPPGTGPKLVIVLGAGPVAKRDARQFERLGGFAFKAAAASGHETLAMEAPSAEAAARMAVGLKLAAYRFDQYRTQQSDDALPNLSSATFTLTAPGEAERLWASYGAGAEGTYLARDLVNLPPSDLYPATFAERIEALGEHGLKVTILGEDKLRELGMGSMLGVGQGSVKESKLAIMEWHGGGDEAPVALVGKGVTFDTGGISLKPGPGMENMRGDMGGAAAVTGAMLALAKRKAKANVVGLVGLVENMPDGDAIRPGDILHSASGKTIEVQNTDAEGRLVLADVLWYVQKHHEPQAIVDLATLTGAIVISLGHYHAGLFTETEDLAGELHAAGQVEGERVWRLPMGPEYDKLLKSKFADMRNIGGRPAGSITAAQFLRRFVKDGVRWAHLDIAGVAWVEGEKEPTDPSWASGFGPRLLNRWIHDNYENG